MIRLYQTPFSSRSDPRSRFRDDRAVFGSGFRPPESGDTPPHHPPLRDLVLVPSDTLKPPPASHGVAMLRA